MSGMDGLTDAELEPDYKGFAEAIMEEWAAHCDIDAGDKFDLAVKFNILRPIAGGYDPEKHSSEWYDAERGDPWYEMNRRASQAAPAPSDGLREALLREVLDCQEQHYGYGMRLHMAMIPLAARIRAALTPAPAQEGGE